MKADNLVVALENEYDPEEGFIGRVRYGGFDEPQLIRLIGVLTKCPSIDVASPDPRMIKLVWYMPWIAQRLTAEGAKADDLQHARDQIFREVERILGVP
jgi:hypothetical protein